MTNPWDQRYGVDEHVYGLEPNAFLAREAHRLAAQSRVLSIGEGEGRNAVFLARQGHQVTGIDGSTVGMAKARKLAEKHGVAERTTFVVGDLAAVEFPSPIDAMVNVFCHLPSAIRRAVHRRAQGVLKPGGLAILELYRPEQLNYRTGGPPDVDMLATLEDLRGDFDDCTLELGEELVKEVVEGTFHSGTAAVVDAVFRRR